MHMIYALSDLNLRNLVKKKKINKKENDNIS